MLMTSQETLFDIAATDMNSAVINLCDCFGNVSSQTNIQFRVRYPGSYAADRMTVKGDPHKLGTVSYTIDRGVIVINAYISYSFTDQRSILNGTIFDPTYLISCMHQAADILGDFSTLNAYISIGSFQKFGLDYDTVVHILQYISNQVPYNVILTV